MGNFSGGSSFGGRRSFGRPSFGGQRPDRQMHKAICSKCGKECELPFRPTGERPVFCSDCFKKDNGSSSSGRFESRDHRRPSFPIRSNDRPQNNLQLEAVSAKLDKILAILESAKAKIIEEPKVAENHQPEPKTPTVTEKKKKKISKKSPSPAKETFP